MSDLKDMMEYYAPISEEDAQRVLTAERKRIAKWLEVYVLPTYTATSGHWFEVANFIASLRDFNLRSATGAFSVPKDRLFIERLGGVLTSSPIKN